MNIQHSGGGSRSFAKERRALEVKSAVASQWTLITTSWEPSLKMILFQLHGKLLKNSTSTILQVIQHLKQMRKMKKLDKWVPHELTANQKNRPSEVLSSPILHNNNAPFLYWIVMCKEKWTLCNKQWWRAQWLDQEETPKHLPKPNLQQQTKRSRTLFGHLLPKWSTTAFWIPVKLSHLRSMLSKLMRCTKSCNTCIERWSRERAQFSSMTRPNCTPHDPGFNSWKDWATKFCLICHIHLTGIKPSG